MTLSPQQQQQIFYMASCSNDPTYLATLYAATADIQLADVATFITDKLPKLQYEQTAIQNQITHLQSILTTINNNITLLTNSDS